MRLKTYPDGNQELSLSAQDTLRWKTRFYPASVLNDERVWIKFDPDNHVVDYTINGLRGTLLIPLEELDAMVQEYLCN